MKLVCGFLSTPPSCTFQWPNDLPLLCLLDPIAYGSRGGQGDTRIND